ncbi:hypothetical protein TWF569_003084 [Orbilia oligospora]|uniref:C2H2-type domain-containing protein n=1 Tax=Orbilia oligospora TaxID=2813651 RepID=A0A7C8NN78_ORBOL|nr:hypothetical protein TWF706_001661 [Orbilia oligospora]KAF3082407.1 hypothetical protein TWF706_001661 [Orbilia oligospora]KAF3082821.1 hypothetical protein TWF102_001055 [Orbilia oligospora]KAF3083696.1 hypothetical protein TWF103_002744 [Orbilia oligospora]KAF3120646.1 hypothetical protein TWF569_003084 [Orbilia oligospora]
MAASSPPYTQGSQYSPYPPQPGHDISQAGYPPQHTGWRPEWGQYHPSVPQQYTSPTASVSNQSSPTTATPRITDKSRRKRLSQDQQHPLAQQQQVYSFVPIPGAQQHKRPRRRYEEIERMYKCGWNGCEKAYGTLNHLNAHVTMQSHGVKRTPEEFKEIRKEWKQRKKEEEAAKKQEEEQARQQQRQLDGLSSMDNNTPTASGQYNNVPQQRQLPPPGYSQPPMQPGMHHYTQQAAGNLEQLQRFNPPTANMYGAYSHGAYAHAPSHHLYQPRQPPGAEEPDADADADPDVPSASYTHT